jgi:3-methyladenine DNA glycosylase AlkC
MPFADDLLNTSTAHALTRAVGEAIPAGHPLPALHAAAARLAPGSGLALRERSDLLRDALLADLPGDYAALDATIRRAAAGPHTFSGWLVWPVTSAVSVRALAEGTDVAFDAALTLLADLTSRLTSEFALRGLLQHDLDRAVRQIRTWTTSPDVDVRRLASEGTRPFLPWAVRVPAILARPHTTVPILDALYRDESDYVRRSVANHLNDLSRREPDLAVEIAERWLTEPGPTTGQVVRHGLRTLVKQGHPGALGLLGYAPADDVRVDGPVLGSATVPFGGDLTFTATLTNSGDGPATLVVDYVVHHRKANGSRTPKTFKLSTRTLAPGETLELRRVHSFRPITTRRYHPGDHAIEVQVNGTRTGPVEFSLLEPHAAVRADPGPAALVEEA